MGLPRVASVRANEAVRESGIRRRRLDLTKRPALRDRLLHEARQIQDPGRVPADRHRAGIELAGEVALDHRLFPPTESAQMNRGANPDHRRVRIQLDRACDLGVRLIPFVLVPFVVPAQGEVRLGAVGIEFQRLGGERKGFRKRVVGANPPVTQSEVELGFGE